jgi:hypothetical protein
MLEDGFRAFFGGDADEQMRAAGFLDDLAESRDRRVEELARRTVRGLWTEMRENAARGSDEDHGLDQLARHLAVLRDNMGKRRLEVHLVGHSAGSILLGHLLPLLAAPRNGLGRVEVASCSLYAAACSVRFALEKYLRQGGSVLNSSDIHLHYLSDHNEKDDFLVGIREAGLHLYGKSLLYLVSRALGEARKVPLLGLERAVESAWQDGDPRRMRDQWDPAHLRYISQWLAAFEGKLYRVDKPSVTVNKLGKTIPAQHGSFDNSIETIGQTIGLMRGKALAKPIEWLDY